MYRISRRTLSGWAVRSLLGGVISVMAALPSAASASSYPVVKNIGPRYTTVGGASVLSTSQTVPHWHGSFVDGENGQTYGFNMVGNDPSTGGSTTVPTEIVPINVVFDADNDAGFGADQVASWVPNSPIFTPSALPSGETAQYLDAVMRSEFNKIGSSYNTLLGRPTILPTQTITVPQSKGAIYQTSSGEPLGLVDSSWYSTQLDSIIHSTGVSPTTLPVLMTNDVYLYQKSVSNCCIIGFHTAHSATGLGGGSTHGNGNQPLMTYAWASWIPSDQIFGPGIGLEDVAALSHEVSEWGHDPFDTNYVNPWSVPGEPQYGCSNILETGDPLVGVDFAVPGSTPNTDPGTGPDWHLQDEAFLWWFERQPTQASNHEYSYIGTFTSPAPTC